MDILLEKLKSKWNRLTEMSKFTPSVRGGWHKQKILKYLKSIKPLKTPLSFYKEIDKYQTFEEFKENLYWHGSPSYSSGGLKPSITFGKKWEDSTEGGGGYGIPYWVISLTKSKKISSNFSRNSNSISIVPVIIREGSNVIVMENIGDSDELEEHIEELWNKGVDAVYIGGGELELCVVNPLCAITGPGEHHRIYKLSIKDPTDEELIKLWDERKEKMEGYRQEADSRKEQKKTEKQAKLEKYEATYKEFYDALEEYKKGNINVYKMIELYIKFYSIAVQAIKHMEAFSAKRELLKVAEAKPDIMDIATLKSKL